MWEDTYTKPRELQSLRKWNAVGLDARFIPLVDASPHYEFMVALFGTQLTVTKTQFLAVPSGCIESPYLHTDAGSMADVIPTEDSAPVMCSIQFFLTDLDQPMMGNFTCVPGSHRIRFPWEDDNEEHSQIRVGRPQGGTSHRTTESRSRSVPAMRPCSCTPCGTESQPTSLRATASRSSTPMPARSSAPTTMSSHHRL